MFSTIQYEYNKGGTRPHHIHRIKYNYIRECETIETTQEKEELTSNINFKLSPIDDT